MKRPTAVFARTSELSNSGRSFCFFFCFLFMSFVFKNKNENKKQKTPPGVLESLLLKLFKLLKLEN